MGMVADRKTSGRNGEGRYSWGFGSLIRRKQVDSVHLRRDGRTQLARKLSAVDLVAIGKVLLQSLSSTIQNWIFNMNT